MEKTREKTLKRLDEWYANLVERHYTPEFENTVKRTMFDLIKETGDIELLIDLAGCAGKFNRTSVIKESQTYFSQTYNELETIMAEIEDSDEISWGVKEEYFQPMNNEFQKVKSFVDRLEWLADEISPEEPDDYDIGQCFLDVFGSVDGYSRFCLAYQSSSLPIVSMLVGQGVLSEKVFDRAETVIKAIMPAVYLGNRKIFGEIKRKGTKNGKKS